MNSISRTTTEDLINEVNAQYLECGSRLRTTVVHTSVVGFRQQELHHYPIISARPIYTMRFPDRNIDKTHFDVISMALAHKLGEITDHQILNAFEECSRIKRNTLNKEFKLTESELTKRHAYIPSIDIDQWFGVIRDRDWIRIMRNSTTAKLPEHCLLMPNAHRGYMAKRWHGTLWHPHTSVSKFCRHNDQAGYHYRNTAVTHTVCTMPYITTGIRATDGAFIITPHMAQRVTIARPEQVTRIVTN